jgi:lipoprotein-anchoring transpeptidase ErfK/SrfK
MAHSTATAVALFAALTATLPAVAAPATVRFDTAAEPGSIVVHTSDRQLFFVLEGGRALRYSVGVGKAGREWTGASSIEAKFVEPNWAPPAEIRRDRPDLPALVAGGTAANPMGAAAMTIAGGPFAIHGTNAPNSIGGFVSYGCIRMLNADITDLYGRVRVGAAVLVLR